MDKKEFKVYRCFSQKQKQYLMNEGHEYVCIAKDANTDALFYLFLRNDEFNKSLDLYSDYVKNSLM